MLQIETAEEVKGCRCCGKIPTMPHFQSMISPTRCLHKTKGAFCLHISLEHGSFGDMWPGEDTPVFCLGTKPESLTLYHHKISGFTCVSYSAVCHRHVFIDALALYGQLNLHRPVIFFIAAVPHVCAVKRSIPNATPFVNDGAQKSL